MHHHARMICMYAVDVFWKIYYIIYLQNYIYQSFGSEGTDAFCLISEG